MLLTKLRLNNLKYKLLDLVYNILTLEEFEPRFYSTKLKQKSYEIIKF